MKYIPDLSWSSIVIQLVYIMSNIFWPPYWTDLLYCRFHNKTISISLPQSFGPLWRTVLRIGYTELDEIEIEMIIAIRGVQGLRCFFTMYSISLSTLRSPPKFHILSKSSTWAWMHRLNLPLWQAKYTKIYCLCNNAGIMARPDEATVDGYDTQMQTNHLSHFLLLLGPSCWHWFCWIQKKRLKGDGTIWIEKIWKMVLSRVFCDVFGINKWNLSMMPLMPLGIGASYGTKLEGSWEKWVHMVGMSDISYIYI